LRLRRWRLNRSRCNGAAGTWDGTVRYQGTAALVVLELLLLLLLVLVLPLLTLRRTFGAAAGDHTANRGGKRGGRADGGGIELSIASSAGCHRSRTADRGGCNGAAEDLVAQLLLLLLLLLLGCPLCALL